MNNNFLSRLVMLVGAVVLSCNVAWGAVTPLSLPKTWEASDGKSAYTEALGCTLSGLGTDYSDAPKLKFDTQGDYMIIQVAEAPGSISFNIKGNGVSGTYSFMVQESSDGNSYTDALNITSVTGSSASKIADLKSTTRYIKLIYVTKASGNMGVGGISITKYSSGGEEGENTITYNFNSTSSYPTGFPTATGTSTSTPTEFTIGGHSLIISAPNAYYIINNGNNTSRALFFGQTKAANGSPSEGTAYLEFPAIEGKKLIQVGVTNASGCAGSVSLNIFTTTWTAISTSQSTVNGSKTELTFELSNPVANTAYRLAASTNGKNLQLDNIVLTYEEATPTPPTPTEYNITYNLTNVTGDNEINPTKTGATEDVECLFEAASGYILPETISVKVGETELSAEDFDYLWDATDGELTIDKTVITDDITITIIGEEEPAPETKRIYLNPCADWKEDNAVFGIYDATNGKWQPAMMLQSDACGNNYYYDDIPLNCTTVVVGRYNPSVTIPFGWGGETFWGQSVNFDVSSNNLITIEGWGNTGDANGKGYGSVTTYEPSDYTVTITRHQSAYGDISQQSVENIPCGTSISADGNKLKVGNTTVTATAKSATAQYTYSFDNWTWTDDVTSVESNITATANFSRVVNSYTVGEITLNNCSIADGSSWPQGETKEYDEEFTLEIVANPGYKLNSTFSTKSGCTPSWDSRSDDETSGVLRVKVTGDVSLTVGTQAKKYTVTWMANGVQHHQQTNISYNATLTMPSTNPEPCDAFHHFMGWTATENYTEATAPGDLFLSAGDKKVTANTTYYAVYGQIGEVIDGGGEEELKATLDLTDNTNWGFPAGNGNRANDEASFTSGDYTIKVKGDGVFNQQGNITNGYYWNNTSYYLALGKSGAQITLPTFNFAVSKITVTGKGGASTFVKQNIFVGETAVSTETTGAATGTPSTAITNEYVINENYRAVGTEYIFKVTSDHNTQVTTIGIYGSGSSISYSSYSTTCSNPTWTVTFDNQGHGAQVAPITNVEHNTTIVAPAAPNATGWAFGGWYKDAACTNAWDFASDKVTGNITLYAKWTCYWRVVVDGVGSYPLSYNSETGKMTADVNLSDNTTYYFYFTDSENGGWTFGLSGDATMTKDNDPEHPWEFNQSTQEHHNNVYCGLATTASGNYTFVATEETGNNYVKIKAYVTYPASVAVTFDKQGKGDNEILYTAPNTALVTLPTNPEALSFRFDGWYNDQECTSPWSSTELIAADKTVYAKWTELRTTLYLNAGVWKTENAGEQFAVYYFTNDEQHTGWSEFMTPYECDGVIYITTIPQGYDKVNFVRLNNTCVTPNWNDKWNQTGNLDLADTWNCCNISSFGDNGADSPCTTSLYSAPQNHITFNDNGADGGSTMATIDLDCGSNVTLPTMTRTKAHYTFMGWEDASGTDYADGATIENVTEDIALTAQWEAIPQYTITFHVPECATTPDPITDYKDEVIDLGEITEPTINNADYTFVGWSRTEQTTADVTCPTIETSITFSENVDLYAIYSVGSEQPTGEFKLSANINGTEYYAQALPSGKKYLGATTSEADGYIFGLDGENLYYNNGETRTYVGCGTSSTDIAVGGDRTNDKYKWTLTAVEGNTITLVNKSTSRYLGGSISSNIARFAAYSSEYQLTRHDIMAGQTEYTSVPVCTPELSSITVDASGATKTTYRQHVDNALITDGIVITAHYLYTDETEEIELSSCQFSTPDFETDGEQAITVTYGDFQNTYNITITPTYRVTYVGGEGATSVPSDNTWYDAGDEVTVLGPGLMGKPNSMFQYWVYNETHYTGNEQIIMPASNITFTAQWIAAITIALHYEGYTTDCDQLMSGPQGSIITLPAGKIVAGETFDGWSDGVNIYHAGDEYTLTESTTLTASYTNWTITLNYNNGTTQTPDVPETGVILPTEAQGESAVNNIFIGFTKTALEEAITDLPADFIPAGSVYTPTAAGETLYALYRQGDAEYKLIKDIKDLRLGAHVVLASIDEDYAMGKEFVAGQDTLPAIVVTKDGDEETITFGNDVQEWILTTSSQAGSNAEYQGTWVFQRSDNKKLASPNRARKITLGTNVSEGSSFRIAIDASGRATAQCVANYNINTLSMGDNGAFGCYNPNNIDAPDLAIYQHIGTKYVTTPTAVYRVKSVDMINGRIDKNDYYEEGTAIDLDGYANEGYSTSNVYRVYGEAAHDTISKTKTFTMPAYNVVDTLTNRAFVDTLKFVVPECVTPTPSNIRANGNTEVNLPNEVANVNSWNFVGWTKTAINDTSEVHSEIFTTYTTPRLKKDSAETFYAIYSYDGLDTEGFVLSTVNSETTYYLGEYVSGSTNRYFNAVIDKAQALVLHNNGGKLYYQSGETVAYLKANAQGTSSVTYNLLTTNEAGATVWTITTEDGKTSIKTTINDQERYLRFNNSNKDRYSIYGSSTSADPVKEKAPSYTTNPVCTLYAYYFTSDAENAEPEYVYELGQDGKVIPYSPANECGAKRFMGWSETKVSALQQSAPSMVDVAIQTYDRDVNLYAVYAAPNGGKVVDTPTITDNVTAMGSFKTAQDSGMTSLNARYYYHNAKYWSNNSSMRMTRGHNMDSSYITTSLIRDLEKIQVVYSNTKPIVSIRSDGNAWTQIALNKIGDSDIYIAKPEVAGDYYVAFSITKGTGDSYSYSDVQAVTYTHNKQYWYSDYSTNCNTVGTATISFKNEDESQAADPIDATSIGEVITLPTPKTAGKHFEGWTINEVNYDGGESYKLSHNVTATATWTDAQLVCTPEMLYVVSAKGKTVRSSQTIQISCPDITTGTLETPADVDQNNGKLHFILENATATEDGLNATLAVEYTGKTATKMADQQVTFTIGSIHTTVTVCCTLLPDQFVIARQNNDKWYALPADITAYKTYAGYEITIDNNNATAPASAVYNLYADSTDEEHKHNPEIVRLAAPNGGRALQAQAADKTNIKVGDSIQYAVDSTYKWIIQTTDNENYTFLNAKTGRALNYSDGKFGTYQNGESLRIFKVETTTATIPVTVTNWTGNSFSFTTTETIPVYDAFHLLVNDVAAESAEITKSFDLYNVTSTTTFDTQQMIQLQWYKDSKLVATASVVTPARVTGNTTLSSLLTEGIDTKSLDIVASSGTLTVDAKATIHNLDIYPGATVAITNDTLTATTLSFHGGLTSTESNYNYDVPRLYIQKEGCSTAPGYIKKNTHVYYYLNVNADNFYPFTVPFKTSGANIRYASKPNTEIQSIWGSAIKISKYNGEARGKGQSTTTKYWQDVAYTSELIPGVGYIITAKKLKGEPYATLRIMMMVSDIDATTDTAAVGAWGVGPETTTAWYNQGWNYIANPYTAMLTGSEEAHHAIQSGTEVRYATIPSPTVDGYDQVPITDADLKPFYGFFIQAGATGNYNFVKNIHNGAPAYLLAEEKPEQEAYISLEGAAMRDRFGLIVGPGHTNDYEINADLTKELGTANDLRAWLMTGETKMAYLAVDDETARTLIPLNLRTPAEGEYTFSLRGSSRVEDLEGLYLYDYENGTVTNIINSDYTFSAPAGAVENRFALSAIRQNKAPTDIGGQTDGRIGREAERLKIVKDGHIYIIVNGVTFNAEGKEVTK